MLGIPSILCLIKELNAIQFEEIFESHVRIWGTSWLPVPHCEPAGLISERELDIYLRMKM